jgi:CTP:molybdopterin cytidylyltransferase MocA
MSGRAAGLGGIVLAAGLGSRFGGPKALAREPDGESWLTRTVDALLSGGCASVVVVLGAGAAEASALLAGREQVTVCLTPDVRAGLSESLRSGLATTAASSTPRIDAVAIVPVDVPDLGAPVVARMLRGAGPDSLRQASFDVGPGHPVIIGRTHWPALESTLVGDTGARDYLAAHGAEVIDCSDLGTGQDVDDRPPIR